MQASRIAAAVIDLDTVPLAVPWDLRQYWQVAAQSVDFSRLANASPFVLPICHANLALIFTTLNINGYFLQKWDQLVLFIQILCRCWLPRSLLPQSPPRPPLRSLRLLLRCLERPHRLLILLVPGYQLVYFDLL